MIADVKKLRKAVDMNGKEPYFGELSGFYSVDTLLFNLDVLGVKRSAAVIIKYTESYYAVLMENLQKQVVIGLDKIWFKEDGYFRVKKWDDFKMPYEMTRRVKSDFSPGILNEMLAKDPDLAAYAFRYGNLEEDGSYLKGSNNYPTLLGLTFKDDFYMRDQLYHLKKYFNDHDLYERFMRENNLTAVNPFKSLAVKDSKIIQFGLVFSVNFMDFVVEGSNLNRREIMMKKFRKLTRDIRG